MCIFSGNINSVTNTKIFARNYAIPSGDRQWIVYSMSLDTDAKVAMILPIPVPIRTAEDAVEFNDFSDKPDFFEKLDDLFPSMRSKGLKSRSPEFGLKVHSVGAFEASFSPSRKDMSRLDERFKLPDATWDSLPDYADWGFVVFKLAEGRAERHPMAFSFPTRFPSKTYFPTTHVHHGTIPEKEVYDHTLYAQAAGDASWDRSRQPAEINGNKVLTDLHVRRLKLNGRLLNMDIYEQH